MALLDYFSNSSSPITNYPMAKSNDQSTPPITPPTQTTPSSPPTTIKTPAMTGTDNSWFSPRSRKQLGLFWAGAGFFMLSSLITRRAMMKRYTNAIPKFYQPSNTPRKVNGALDALDALSLATVNVLSVGIMVVGGMSWVFDVASVDDLRARARGAMKEAGVPMDGQAEEEIQEWIATVLARRDFKEMMQKSKWEEAMEKLKEMEKKEMERNAEVAAGKPKNQEGK